MPLFTNDAITSIISSLEKALPFEGCGYLAVIDDIISVVKPMKNRDNSKVHFSFDPQDQFKVLRELRDIGARIVGVFHSHPQTEAYPSAEDIRLVNEQSWHYVIVSFADAEPVMCSFHIENGDVTVELIEIQ